MRGGRILWGQIAVVLTIVFVMMWAATQWTAWRLGFQPQLGSPWFELAGWPVYYPPAFFWWWFSYDAYAPVIFTEGGIIAVSGGLLAIVAAITMSIIRSREARNIATYGSARWAEDKEIRSAGLLGPDEAEHLGSAAVQAFEIEGLVGTGAAPAVLAYLFHRIGDRLDGRPTLLIIDEGWLALDDEGFAGQLREWLKTLRKKNASVIFATQSLSDIDNSSIAPAIIESCPTRLLLPNERAIEPQITAIYRRFGLNDRQIEILARATPKRDYYCQSRRGNRLFELGLSEVGLALCAASSKSDQTLIANLVAEYGRDGFLAAWLRARDAGWAADLIPTFPIPQAAKES